MAQATAEIQRIPGGVEVVPDTQFKDGPANTIKDILGWVPGVLIQTRWGPDGRISIRGSGLSRSFGNRGINPYMDGIPINTADGLFDLFEIDPTAYRYVEVFKGANALRYGSNSLGGAINFVMPTGRDASPFEARFDAGSFGYLKTQTSSGGAYGPADYFITASAQREDKHSRTDTERLNANFGYQFSPDAETRFYVNAGRWRAEIPGEVTKTAALSNPRAANPDFLIQDQQRNIDTVRLANKTTLRFDNTTVDFGIFGLDRHVDHPIFQYLDFTAKDYGGFVRATDDRLIGGFRNRLITGVTLQNGTIDINQYINLPGAVKGPLASSNLWKSENTSIYGDNSFFVLPNVALVAGGLFMHAVRDQRDRFLTDGDQSGRRTWDNISPRVGLLWDVDPAWQVFGNISRSAEVPTFDVNTFATPASSNVDIQTATTYEIGTRGRRPDVTWDVSLYRANIRNELQCLTVVVNPFFTNPCVQTNAGRTFHQGVEAGAGVAFLKSVFTQEDRVWFNLVYTYGDFRFHDDAIWGNNRLPGAPAHYLRAEVLYKNPNGFYAGPNVEWMPQSFFADNANTLTIDPYALLNFKVGYDTGVGWSGYIEGRNLLDKRYISSTITVGTADPTMALFNPGTGRAIYGGVRYRM
ncbi:TonB-dependent receptor [Bradyrhizobium barranii subsp. apii]|uniref:TonB-dependent receptor family protein n=1 Tax=Bradyrhizobium barranii TaxID=2992140 RepID=UPI001CD46769|nr:TonB-dependent receptor [Bradyrhizobium barranii]UPT93236.1 TonB-dependent receptor [Bradyrhizobium barranii subsp. apii]